MVKTCYAERVGAKVEPYDFDTLKGCLLAEV